MTDNFMEEDKVEVEGENAPEILRSTGNLNIVGNNELNEVNSSRSKSEECGNVEINCCPENKDYGNGSKVYNDVDEVTDAEICGAHGGNGGSEEEFFNSCQPCLESNKNVESLLYCIECEDFLCSKCVEMHRVVKPSKNHHLVPKDSSEDELKINKKEACPIHTNEYLEWFCISDDNLCCNICKATAHIKCESIVSILSVAETTSMKSVEEEILKTQSRLNDDIVKRNVDMTNLEKDRINSLQVLEKIMADTEDTFQHLTHSLEKEEKNVESIYQKEKELISINKDYYSRIIKGLDKALSLLRKKNISNESKFIQMKKAEQYLQTVQNMILNMQTEPLSTPIGYERDKQYDEYLGAFKRFGYFDSDKRLYACSKPRKMKILKDHEKETIVLDICEAENNRILITDWNNCCIRLIDSSVEAIKHTLKTPSNPFGICRLEDRMFAVTITFSRTVIFIKFQRNALIWLKEKSAFDTGENCRGIAYSNERMFVACGGQDEKEGPGHIKVFDMEGKVLQTIFKDTFGDAVVHFPCKIKFLQDGTTAIVTDTKQLIQIDVSKDNDIKTKMLKTACAKFWFPSLCINSSGHILITDYFQHSVVLLSQDYSRVQPVVTGLQDCPASVMLDHASSRLYVGLFQSSDLLWFQLENNRWEKPPTFR